MKMRSAIILLATVLLGVCTHAYAVSSLRVAYHTQSDCSAASLVKLTEYSDGRCDSGNTWQLGSVLNPDGSCRPDMTYPSLFIRVICSTLEGSSFLTDIAQSSNYVDGHLQSTVQVATGLNAGREWSAGNVYFVNSLGFSIAHTVTK